MSQTARKGPNLAYTKPSLGSLWAFTILRGRKNKKKARREKEAGEMSYAAKTERVSELEEKRDETLKKLDQAFLLCRLKFQRESNFPMTTTQILQMKRELAILTSEGKHTFKLQ